MPADSTRFIGQEALKRAGKGVLVNLSNGEYKLPPEQVHAIGVQALDQARNATHEPVGFAPRGAGGATAQEPEPRAFFADGGEVEDPNRPRPGTPGNVWPNSQPSTNIYGDSHTSLADAGRGAAGFVANAFPGTTAALRGAAQDTRDAYRKGGFGAAVGTAARVAATPVIGLADDVMGSAARVLDPAAQGLKTFVTGDATPIGQAPAGATPQTPATPANAAPQAGGATSVPAGQNGPVPPAAASTSVPAAPATRTAPPAATAPAATASAAGIYRVGNSFSDTPEGAAAGAQPRGLPTARNNAAYEALAARNSGSALGNTNFLPGVSANSMVDGTRGFAPPSVRTSANDWETRNNLRNLEVSASSITNAPGRRGQPNVAQQAYQAALNEDLAARGLRPKLESETNQTNAAIQREGMQQAGANQRAAMSQQAENRRTALDARRLGLEAEARGFDIRSGYRMERLQQQYESAATPAEKAQVAQQMRELSGKTDQANRYTVVPGGQEWDSAANTMRNVPGRVLNNQTGQFIDQGGRALPPLAQNPQAMAVANDTSLSKEQRKAKLQEMGYQ